MAQLQTMGQAKVTAQLWLWPGLRFWKSKGTGSGHGFGKWCTLENENKIIIIIFFWSLDTVLRLVCQTWKSDDENSVTFTKSPHMPHTSTAFVILIMYKI